MAISPYRLTSILESIAVLAWPWSFAFFSATDGDPKTTDVDPKMTDVDPKTTDVVAALIFMICLVYWI